MFVATQPKRDTRKLGENAGDKKTRYPRFGVALWNTGIVGSGESVYLLELFELVAKSLSRDLEFFVLFHSVKKRISNIFNS